MLGVHSYSGRQDLLDMAFTTVNVDGMYLEFGVATGMSDQLHGRSRKV